MGGRNFDRDVRNGRRSLFQLRETRTAPGFKQHGHRASITYLSSLFPLMASRFLLPLSILDIIAGVTLFVGRAFILSPIPFKFNLRDERH